MASISHDDDEITVSAARLTFIATDFHFFPGLRLTPAAGDFNLLSASA